MGAGREIRAKYRIPADRGGSNGSRLRLWKWELQKLAQQTGRIISVCHLPPGTSKWNKIEHRLFSFISQNWCGQPLLTHAAIVSLIAATRTRAVLKVRCVLDPREYPKGLKPTDEQMAFINLKPDSFHGDWNYTILPRGRSPIVNQMSLRALAGDGSGCGGDQVQHLARLGKPSSLVLREQDRSIEDDLEDAFGALDQLRLDAPGALDLGRQTGSPG